MGTLRGKVLPAVRNVGEQQRALKGPEVSILFTYLLWLFFPPMPTSILSYPSVPSLKNTTSHPIHRN
jgi:hypothetical protein